MDVRACMAVYLPRQIIDPASVGERGLAKPCNGQQLAAPTQAWPSILLLGYSAIDIRQQHNFAAAQCVGDMRML